MSTTAEQLEIRALAHDFAEREIRPHVLAWDAGRALPDGIFVQLAELGFLGMLVPEAHGGLAFDASTYLLVLEELAWGDAAVALSVGVHNALVAWLVARHGSEDQRSALLPVLARGDALGAFALSEPGAGSDLRALAATAEREEGGWRLSGTKRWVTNGARAGLAVVFARTGGEGVGAFLVDLPAEGWSVTGRERTMGLRASQTVTVRLDRLWVPDGRVLGEAEEGLSLALEALDVARIGAAAQAIGIARAALEHALAYVSQREQFGQPIARFGAVREKLAEMTRRIAAGRALAQLAAARLPGPRPDGIPAHGPESFTALAAMAKLTASEAAMYATDEAVQLFGGYGYMRDYPVEKLLRDAKGTEIYEGASEILRVVIAREVMREQT